MALATHDAEAFRQLLYDKKRIVFFGGAGVSTASGIPDFRSPQGLYNERIKTNPKPWAAFNPEVLLSHSFYVAHPEWFYDYYRSRLLHPSAGPNICHHVLARWEVEGRLLGVVTQNIDGLHQAAGSTRVAELHGSVHRNQCQRCGRDFTLSDIDQTAEIWRCACGGLIKPEVTLYEEVLPEAAVASAVKWLNEADLLIVAGTSLSVYPAAGLLRYYGGVDVVVINLGETSYDAMATIYLRHDIAEVFAAVADVFAEEE